MHNEGSAVYAVAGNGIAVQQGGGGKRAKARVLKVGGLGIREVEGKQRMAGGRRQAVGGEVVEWRLFAGEKGNVGTGRRYVVGW